MLQLTTILFFIAASILAVIHNLALKLYLYWVYWWLDIPMHALGGIVIALGVFTLYDLRIIRSRSLLKVFPVLCFVLLVALGWEVYEYLIGIPIQDDFIIDTSIDLVMGLTGGYIGYFVGNNIRQLN